MARRRSISVPIVLSSVSVALCITMLVMWILVLVRNRADAATQFGEHVGLMVSGIISFVTISTVLVLFTVFLVREIREVRRQDSFIDSVTHELKSPLASLRLSLETMARRELDAERRDKLREMALDDVNRLNLLIDGVLAASRVGVDKRARQRERVRLAEMVEQSKSGCARRYRLGGNVEGVFDVDVPAELELMTDPNALRLIVDNLLDNALKYSGDTPKIVVRAQLVDGKIELTVKDEGIGVAKTDLRRIFERFYRAPEEAVRERHGTGLGLYIVQAMVRTLGGRVEAESEGPGKGTTFRVRLPHQVPA